MEPHGRLTGGHGISMRAPYHRRLKVGPWDPMGPQETRGTPWETHGRPVGNAWEAGGCPWANHEEPI